LYGERSKRELGSMSSIFISCIVLMIEYTYT
jgi:hypothetical protein